MFWDGFNSPVFKKQFGNPHRESTKGFQAFLAIFTDITSRVFSSFFVHDRLFSAVTVTRFPRPVSPLQDVAIIIGSREQLAVLLQLYDYQLEHEGTTGWETLLWVVNQLWVHLYCMIPNFKKCQN